MCPCICVCVYICICTLSPPHCHSHIPYLNFFFLPESTLWNKDLRKVYLKCDSSINTNWVCDHTQGVAVENWDLAPWKCSTDNVECSLASINDQDNASWTSLQASLMGLFFNWGFLFQSDSRLYQVDNKNLPRQSWGFNITALDGLAGKRLRWCQGKISYTCFLQDVW